MTVMDFDTGEVAELEAGAATLDAELERVNRENRALETVNHKLNHENDALREKGRGDEWEIKRLRLLIAEMMREEVHKRMPQLEGYTACEGCHE